VFVSAVHQRDNISVAIRITGTAGGHADANRYPSADSNRGSTRRGRHIDDFDTVA